jgi:hypothetical protein
MRSVLKVLPLAVLGLAAALLVACGDRSGLLSDSQAGSLQESLAAAQAACADGDSGRAAVAAQSFADRVAALPSGQVDRRLVGDLREGAATLQSLVTRTCRGTAATTTTTTPTVTTTTPTTTATTPTTTTPTETTTTPTTPTTPPATAPPTTTPPDNGGETPGGGDTTGPGGGGAPGDSGGASPGQLKKALRELREGPKE